ncbi:ATP-binding protein [Arcobacter sp. YIC-464]|uniref:ATP-binding protein n=1 Tax=Arcobacter sp. YIC-464 TaxID=3376631 RepID=UPI003C2A9137
MSFKYRFIVSFVLLEIFFIILIVSMNFIAINNSSNKLTNQNIQSNITFLDELMKIPLSIYDVGTIDNLILKATSLSYIDSIVILDLQNKIISKDYNFHHLSLEELIKKEDSFKLEIDNEYYDIKVEPIKEGELKLGTMYIVFDTSESKQFISNNKNNTITIILVEILFSTLLSFIIGSKITKRLTTLSDVAEQIGQNKKPEIPYKDAKNEMGTLARSLSKMQEDLTLRSNKLKDLAKKLNRQKNELIEAHKAKDAFLANMSHELKTPLNSINVISAVMMKNKQNRLDEEYQKNMTVINRCGKDLLYLINDILDISKLEANEITLDYQAINLCEFIDEIDDMFRPQAKQKNLTFEVSCDESIGIVNIDKNRVNQIIKNLLSNALKFTREGKIQLIVRSKDDLHMEIIVKDDGIGIESSKLEHIFDRFKQADSSTTRKYGGTGLGLAISKELCNLMGGDIYVQSVFNEGTVFTATIKKNSVSKATIPEKSETSESFVFENKEILKPSNKNIYLLNNDPVAFLSIVTKLAKDFTVKQATNFRSFASLIEEANKNDLLIIDLDENIIDSTKELDLRNAILIYEDENLIIDIKDRTKMIFKKNEIKDQLLTYIKEKL